MTELQKLELDMLKEFIRICDELNLTYYLVCGSALGAAKYQGFIPWDDDLDVALPREDYDVFCEKAQSMLPEHLFLQNHLTDEQYPLYMSKIRNSNTTFIERIHSKIDMNHGVYIDVFPLDGYPNDEKNIKKFERQKVLYNRRRLVRCEFNRFTKPLYRQAKNIALLVLFKTIGYCRNTQKITNKFSKITAKYPCKDSKLWCNHGNWQGKLEYAPKEQYGKGMMTKFEGIDVRIPEKYDEYLTQKYGDWRLDLPEEAKKGSHKFTILDITKPYAYYKNK